jgi:DNA-binding NarL/FixJ family response regulator
MNAQETFDVLIIDDDTVDRMRTRRLMRESPALRNLNAAEAIDIASGLAALRAGEFGCVLLDYSLPDGNGIALLRELAALAKAPPPVIMQTVCEDEQTGMQAIEAGAQDYLIKGRFDSKDLARSIRYARERHKLLSQKTALVRELQAALEKVKTLEGILPICSVCKKVRSDDGYWDQVEKYVSKHSLATFSHGFCPECLEKEFKKAGLETPSAGGRGQS